MKNKPEIDKRGTKFWYNEKREHHREDGPAIEGVDGYKSWWISGERHREDGPAIEYPDGEGEWYYNNKFINCDSQEEFERLIQLLPFE